MVIYLLENGLPTSQNFSAEIQKLLLLRHQPVGLRQRYNNLCSINIYGQGSYESHYICEYNQHGSFESLLLRVETLVVPREKTANLHSMLAREIFCPSTSSWGHKSAPHLISISFLFPQFGVVSMGDLLSGAERMPNPPPPCRKANNGLGPLYTLSYGHLAASQQNL